MKIGLILDNPKRDLDGLILLSYQLVKFGHTVSIVPLYDQGYDIPLLGLDLIVVNYVRSNNFQLLQKYKKMGIYICVMDTEGGVLPEIGNGSAEFWAKYFNSIGGNKVVDKYFFWGRGLYSAFHLYGGLSPEQLSVTGCPRFDLCNSKWRPALGNTETLHILINLNFPSINPWWGSVSYYEGTDEFIFNSAEEEIAKIAEIGNTDVASAAPLENARKMVFKRYLNTIRELAKLNSEKKFVLRPHPFENNDIYRIYFLGMPNVYVDSNDEVTRVINKSSLILNLNCSTSVEARLLDKLPVSLEFLNSDALRYNVNLPSRISIQAKGFDELNELVKSSKPEEKDYLSKLEIMAEIEQWFYKCDGDSALRIASQINSTHHSNRYPRKFVQILNCVKSSQKGHKLHLIVQGIAALFLGSNFVSLLRRRIRPERSFKYTTVPIVKSRLEAIANCEKKQFYFHVEHARSEITGFKLTSINLSIRHF